LDCAVFILSLTFRYLLFYALAVAGLVAVALATGDWMTGLIGSLIPTMFASLMCGVAYARRTGRRASSDVAWGMATLFAVVSSVVGLGVFLLRLSGDVRGRLVEVAGESPMGLLIFALIGLLVSIIAARIFFGLGSRTWHAPARA
jgi:hypothetical protein